MNNKYLGIEIGGTKFQVVVTDDHANILNRVADTVGDEKEAIVIQKKIVECVSRIMLEYEIKAIGVAFGGPIDIKSGEIFTSYHVNGWNNFNIKSWLATQFNVPVYVDNDANIAALAEARLGCGKEYKRVFYITLGSGVGGGFIIDGEIYHGKSLCEVEFGHIRLNKSGETVELCCSGWALNKNLQEYISVNQDGILARLVNLKGTDPSKCLLEAINEGDSGAKQIFCELTDNLAFGLSHVVHILNPDIIIIGGGLSLIGEYLSKSISKNLPEYLMSSMKNSLPEIKIAHLKEDVVPLGAVLLAMLK